VLPSANLTLQNLSLAAGNPGANPGGAVFNQGILSLVQVTLQANTATQGGGIKNDTGATLTIDRSTISGNLAVFVPGKGGAIYNGGTMTLVNSTISNNIAQDDGAGMEVGATSNTTIINSTIAFNITQGSPGEGGAIFNFGGAPVTVRNSILANNAGFTGPNCYGPVISQGNNLSNTGECSLNAAGDLLSIDPNLGALLNNGGATQTHALTSGSPAIDAGDAGACAAAPVNGIDQRGVVRPQGAGCDIGAYETFLIDFNGLPAQSGDQAKAELNNAYAARGLSFDFYQIYLTYPTTDGATVIAATHPDGADALVNFAFAADFVRVKFADSDGPEAYLTAYAQPFMPDLVPATTIDAASDLGNPYPKSLTVTGACIRSVQLETNGFDFSFDDLEIHPMSGPDTDGDGIVDQCDSEFIVNSNDDSDDGVCNSAHCSLREAILAANANVNGATPDEIQFNIPGAGVHTIQPTTALPYPSEALIIDGTTQPGSSCPVLPVASPPALLIELDGSNAGVSPTSGLVSFVGNMTVRGLVIHSFANENIGLYSGDNTIQCNFLGTDPTGTLAQGSTFDQIFVNGTANNLIGGPTPGAGNLIAGNSLRGIVLPTVTNNTVQGNYIGTNASGTALVGNRTIGIMLSGNSNLIGGAMAGTGNVIAGSNSGIDLSASTGDIIQGNYIGKDSAGTTSLPNSTGIIVGAGTSNATIRDNIIAYNGGNGVQIEAGVGTAVRSNRIFANGGLAIDLGADGVTFNHQGTIAGPNNYQNYPVLATVQGDNTRVQGTLESTPGTSFDLDIFANTACDGSEFGEGQTYIGTIQVPIDDSGKGSFDQTL
jgi:CSLREA domain-containing protein